MNVNIPLTNLCAHITDDVFWKRSFHNKWKEIQPNATGKSWIKIFLEKHCSETIEKMKPIDYDCENITIFIELCSPHVEHLKINELQPSMIDNLDHLPFNVILPNLNELRKLDLTYDVKSISTNFYLGCSTISQNDIKNLTAGLEKCYELREFRLSGTKLEPYMLKLLARALEKGCSHIESIAIPHCRCGDVGLLAFLDSLNFESFPHLKEVVLTNNFLCSYELE